MPSGNMFLDQQRANEAIADVATFLPPPTQSPDPQITAPTQYALGLLPSFSNWIMRAVQITGFSIIEPEQYINQQSLIHDWGVEGRWQPLAQNIAVLTAQATAIAPTLVPAYGQTLDTPNDVYRNIITGWGG